MAAAILREIGLAGDSQQRRMRNLFPSGTTFSHYSKHIVSFAKSSDLKYLIMTYPQTKAILYSFGGNDIDCCFTLLDPDYHKTIGKAFTTLTKDTLDLGALPFYISIIPRTQFTSHLSIDEYRQNKMKIEEKVKEDTQRMTRYDAFIDVDDLVELEEDGVHLTTESMTEVARRTEKHIKKIL